MPNPIARIRNFWRFHGEWVLLGICCVLFTALGYSLASHDWREALMNQARDDRAELVRQTDKLEGEKQYLRDRIVEKNNDIRRLSGNQGEATLSANKAAATTAEAIKAISENKEPAK